MTLAELAVETLRPADAQVQTGTDGAQVDHLADGQGDEVDVAHALVLEWVWQDDGVTAPAIDDH